MRSRTGKPQDASRRGFGSEVIRMLIPHRRPFLMVDRVEDYRLKPNHSLLASRYISSNEEVFAGHFPDWNVWPGVYTIEGLGQSCLLLSLLVNIHEWLEAEGREGDELVAELHNLELGYRMRPGFRAEASLETMAAFRKLDTMFGLGSVYNIKLLHPVFAGQRLDYSVALTRRIDKVLHFEVEALVDGQPVALGTLGSASVVGVPGLWGIGAR